MGVLKGGLGSIRVVVLGHWARTKMLGLPEQFGVARLLEDVVYGFPGPGSFLAVQPCYPDLSQNGENVDFSL